MIEILSVTSPIFLIIGLGYVSVRIGYFQHTALLALGTFVLRFCLPALIFKSLSGRSVAEVINTPYLVAYAMGSLATLSAGLSWARWIRKKSLGESAIYGMGMSCSNSGYFGYSIALQLLGPIALLALALTMLIENILMIPVCIALADSGGKRHEKFKMVLWNALLSLRMNPIFISMLIGLIITLCAIKIPAPLLKSIDILAAGSAPAALFFIGGSLVGLRIRGLVGDVSAVVSGKLLLHPLLVAIFLTLFGPVEPMLAIGAVVMASSPMLSIYSIFGQKQEMQGFCAASQLLATVASFVSIGTIIWLLHATELFGKWQPL